MTTRLCKIGGERYHTLRQAVAARRDLETAERRFYAYQCHYHYCRGFHLVERKPETRALIETLEHRGFYQETGRS